MRARLTYSRGQTLIETAICLPIMLLVLFGVIYFSNAGVVNARAQLTARYGATSLFASNTAPTYSAADIYNATNDAAVCQSPPTSILYNGPPFPAPTSAPYWNPSAAGSSCSLQTKDLGGASFLMARYLTAGDVVVTASPWTGLIPGSYLSQIVGATAPGDTASLAWVHPAWPGAILACIAKTDQAVEDLLTATETVTLPTGWNPGSCNLK